MINFIIFALPAKQGKRMKLRVMLIEQIWQIELLKVA